MTRTLNSCIAYPAISQKLNWLWKEELAMVSACLLRVGALAACLGFPASVAAASEFPLLSGEVVDVLIYGRDDISGQRAIDPSGELLVPLLGRVAAAGGTVAELEARIQTRLTEAGLVTAPEVYVDVVQRRDVHVAGAVQNPGAQPWSPGSTVEQIVVRAGGPRVIPVDELGKMLQAYSAIENFKALLVSIGELEAREARLRAEMAFAAMAFVPAVTSAPRSAPRRAPRSATASADPSLPPEAEALDLVSLLPSESAHDIPGAVLGVLANYDLAQFREIQRQRPNLRLVRFPEQVASNPLLIDIRATQQELIVDHLVLRLTTRDSIALQRTALEQQAAAYDEQHALFEESVEQLEAQLENVRSLRAQGLARESDLLDLQSAYAGLLSSRITLLSAIAENRTQLLQKDLEARSFGARLRGELGRELEQVRGTLSAARSRQDEAHQAAALAGAYRQTEQVPDAGPPLSYEIRRGGEGELLAAEPTTAILPGDLVVVSIAAGL
jgi:hypothetical protein